MVQNTHEQRESARTLTNLGAVRLPGAIDGLAAALGDVRLGAHVAEPDPVRRPAHYHAPGGLEAIDVIEAFPHLRADFRLGNAAKYLLRGPAKGTFLEDLKKLRQYVTRVINELEGNGRGWDP